MAQLASWARGIVVLVLLAGVVEMVAPEGSTRRFVRLAMGLLVLLAVLRPVASFLARPGSGSGFALPAGGRGALELQPAASEGGSLAAGCASVIERQLELCAGQMPGVERVDAQVTLSWGESGVHPVKSVRFDVRLAGGSLQEVKAALVALAARLYGVPPGLVEVRIGQ